MIISAQVTAPAVSMASVSATTTGEWESDISVETAQSAPAPMISPGRMPQTMLVISTIMLNAPTKGSVTLRRESVSAFLVILGLVVLDRVAPMTAQVMVSA